MKNLLLFPVLALCAIMMATCQKKDAPAGFSMEKTFENDTLTVYKTNNGYTISDTIFKHIYDTYNKNIDNKDLRVDYTHFINITDEQGRPLAAGYYDNEDNLFDFTKYLYGENGKVKGIVNYGDGYYKDITVPGENIDTYDDFIADEARKSLFDTYDENFSADKILFDLIFNKSENEPYFTRYYFIRDDSDRIVKVYDPILYRSFAAPDGYHIDYHIENIPIFVYGDIGLPDKYFTLVSNDKNEDDEFDGCEIYKYQNIILKGQKNKEEEDDEEDD